MFKYITKRVLSSILTLIIIAVVILLLLRQMPEDGYFENYEHLINNGEAGRKVIDARLRELHVSEPFYKHVAAFFKDLLHGNLGVSYKYRQNATVTSIIGEKCVMSAEFGLASMVIALILGIPLGGKMAHSKIWDKCGTVFIVIINAVPAAIYYIFIQMYGTKLLGIQYLFDKKVPLTWVLPTLSMALGNIAYYAMWLRRYMVDEMTKDYVKLARAKGASAQRITFKHVFRNAFVPMIQYLPSSLLYTVCGSIYLESIYSIPGMGGLLVDAIQRQDNPLVQALVLIYASIGIIGLLIGDIMMSVLDPRISFVKKEGAR